ncbi:unnamed protein product [Hymenolepis diminuta]|uniref:RING-type domain-containing protein n=1 Tax=Hymenolepis diminuta TaxID=6216 RepID=A0A564YST6_HYMDI|nr:unnamed protein product [Hymenolepis diminuta]
MSNSDVKNCQICRKVLRAKKATPSTCDHVFHIKCIEKWIKDNRDQDGRCQCPAEHCRNYFTKVLVLEKNSGNKCHSFTVEAKSNNCGICWNSLNMHYANPACCRHKFCYNCLKRWAEINNSCPLCRKRFQEMLIYNRNGSKRENIVPRIPQAIPTEIVESDPNQYLRLLESILGIILGQFH